MTIRHTDCAGEKCILNKTKSSKKIIILLSVIAAVLAVILCILLIMIAAGKMSAVTIRLSDYTGEISLTDKTGEDIPVSEDKRLSDGNTLSTYEESKARVLLDENRMVTIMELSSATFSGKGKKLVLELSDGSLFFNIEKPLGDDESFEISTSTMIIGIRGTSGFVDTDENGNEAEKTLTSKGVYIRKGEQILFKKIKVVYEGSDYILSDVNDDPEYLALYDDIMIEEVEKENEK